MLHDLSICRLQPSDAPAIARLLSTATESDRRFFQPFAYHAGAVDAALRRMRRDCMYGVSQTAPNESPRLVAFYMLRGLDEGFESPMYGVFVAPEFRRNGLASLTVRHAASVCRTNALPSLLLKVFPENRPAVRAYETLGFTALRAEPPQCVMQLKLAS